MGGASDWPSTQSALIGQLHDATNAESWRTFVEIYGPLLYRLCLRQRLQDADAADVVQNVLARVSRFAWQYDRHRAPFRAWLITIAAREIQRHRGRQRKQPEIENYEEIAAELTASWAVGLQARLYEAALERTRQAFDPDVWSVFQQVWIERRKPSEVARSSDRSIRWVYRSRRAVLERFQQETAALAAETALFCDSPAAEG